jgi:2-polyprenyl-3-methyl-5-hydroxy-6-metoxy-1,4-benzoquinol methylase
VEQVIRPGLEQVACNLCQSTQTRPFAQRGGMQVVQCVQCGLVYVNPRLDPEHVYQHYNSDRSSRTSYYLEVEVADRRTFAEVLDLAARLALQRGKLLDIGPNIGTCLTLARDRGWDSYGIEINDDAARYCREQRRLNVISGALDEHTYAANSFDVVLMGDVIEHLGDPLALMAIVQRILKPGGVVIISTPNVAGWAARLMQIKPEEHLYYFAPDTIAALLRKVGLEVVGVKCLDRYHNLTAMTHSTTFGGVFQALAPLFRLTHRLIGDLVMKLPLRENLIAVARKPVGEGLLRKGGSGTMR